MKRSRGGSDAPSAPAEKASTGVKGKQTQTEGADQFGEVLQQVALPFFKKKQNIKITELLCSLGLTYVLPCPKACSKS